MLYPKDTQKWKQFTTIENKYKELKKLCCIPKILKNESNSQQSSLTNTDFFCCVVSQRYSKMKAIHNCLQCQTNSSGVVLYPKDTQKWKQFTTDNGVLLCIQPLCCIPKILKNESNSQLKFLCGFGRIRCVVSQRYSKMKAIHNSASTSLLPTNVVLYPKDTQKWKQFTTSHCKHPKVHLLCCIPKILKNESNSQLWQKVLFPRACCVVSQRYSKMKAIHNFRKVSLQTLKVVLYPKDTQKWKQFTTFGGYGQTLRRLCCIPKILKNESNSQPQLFHCRADLGCVVSQRYSKMKAIHNYS